MRKFECIEDDVVVVAHIEMLPRPDLKCLTEHQDFMWQCDDIIEQWLGKIAECVCVTTDLFEHDQRSQLAVNFSCRSVTASLLARTEAIPITGAEAASPSETLASSAGAGLAASFRATSAAIAASTSSASATASPKERTSATALFGGERSGRVTSPGAHKEPVAGLNRCGRARRRGRKRADAHVAPNDSIIYVTGLKGQYHGVRHGFKTGGGGAKAQNHY